MADTPKRPIKFVMVFGKGRAKRRRESDNPTQFLIEQVVINYAQNTWDSSRRLLQQRILEDVHSELIAVAREFRRNVIGAPANQRGVVGTLKTVAKGEDAPTESLGKLPRWAPRGAKYLERKFNAIGHTDWFDNTGGKRAKLWPHNRGHLKDFFEADVVGTTNVGGGGIFEEMFGGISVQVIRNNKGWGVQQGTITIGKAGKHAQVQLGTVRVRALGLLTEKMLSHTDSSVNKGLLDLVARQDRETALHLRGGQGRYRPALEPYLRFFIERAMPHAVAERIRRGNTIGHVNRTS